MIAGAPLLKGREIAFGGWSRAAAVASVLLRELGAHVSLIEGESDPSLEPFDRYRAEIHGSRVAVEPAAGWEAVIARSDALVQSHVLVSAGGDVMTPEAVAAANPRLVHCVVTAFPRGGEWAAQRSVGRSVEAVSGLMRVGYAYAGDQPVYTPRPLAAYGTALLIVAAVTLGFRLTRRTGTGSCLEVSETSGALLPQVLNAIYPVEPETTPGPDRDPDPLQVNTPTIRCFEAADGWLLMAAPSTDAWARAAIAMDRPDLAIDEAYAGAPWALSSREVREKLTQELAATLKTRTVAEWREAFRQVSVPCAPVLSTSQFKELSHLVESETVGPAGADEAPRMWKTAAQGGVEAPAAPAAADASPALGSVDLPLRGVKVVELATFAAGPYAGAVLADYGAEVTKIEQPPGGDPYREQGLTFAQINRGKRSRIMDLRADQDRAEFDSLISQADVLLINLRPEGLSRMQLEFDQIVRRNPRIVYCWVTGWGSGSDLANEPGVDPIFQAVSGLAYSNGGYSGALRLIPSGLLDNYTGLAAVCGIVAALERVQTGERAQYVETTLLRSSILAQFDDFCEDRARPSLGADPVGPRALDRIYRARDEWLYLSIADQEAWTVLADLLNAREWVAQHPGAITDGYDSELSRALSERFATDTRENWLKTLSCLPPSGVAVPVYRPVEVLDAASLPGRELFVDVRDEEWGPLHQLAPFIGLVGRRPDELASAPRLGGRG